MNSIEYTDFLTHSGIKGQKWGVRRYQNEDGSLTEEGKKRYAKAQKTVERLNKETERHVSAQLAELGAQEAYGNTKNKFSPKASMALTTMQRAGKLKEQTRRNINKILSSESLKNLDELNAQLGYNVITGRYNLIPNQKKG